MASVVENTKSMSAKTQAVFAWVGKPLKSLLYIIASFGILLLIWVGLHNGNPEFPDPILTLQNMGDLLANAFNKDYEGGGPIGTYVLASLSTVGLGFLLGSLVAIPLGIIMGSNEFFQRLFNPIAQILRPVSPIAWFVLGAMLLHSSSSGLVFMIFICSLWPTLLNTSLGVASVPKDFVTLSKVFKFSPFRYVFSVLLPQALPNILTGLRLSIGIGWMVIVAGEALAGKDGIGKFVWDAWQGSRLDLIVCAIIIIGLIGLIIDSIMGLFVKLATPGDKS